MEDSQTENEDPILNQPSPLIEELKPSVAPVDPAPLPEKPVVVPADPTTTTGQSVPTDKPVAAPTDQPVPETKPVTPEAAPEAAPVATPEPTPAPVTTTPVIEQKPLAPPPKTMPAYWPTVLQESATLGVKPETISKIAAIQEDYHQGKGPSLGIRPKDFADIARVHPSLELTEPNNPEQQAKAAPYLLERINTIMTQRLGRAPSEGETFLAWKLGEENAAKVLKATPDTPIEYLVDPETFVSNSAMFKGMRTTGDAHAWADRQMGTPGSTTTVIPGSSRNAEVPEYWTDKEKSKIVGVHDDVLKVATEAAKRAGVRVSVREGSQVSNELNIIDRSNPNFHYSKSATANAQPFKYIVLHHAEGTAENLVKYGQRDDPGRGGAFGYHYYIEKDGTILQGAPDDKRTNHVKAPTASQRKLSAPGDLSNSNALGITLAEGHKGATPEQLAALDRLVPHIQDKYKIAGANILGHGDLQTDRQHNEGEYSKKYRTRESNGAAIAAAAPKRVPLTETDKDLLVRTVYGEIGDRDGAVGQQAVAAVILNRQSQKKGSTVEQIVKAPMQFEPWRNAEATRKMLALDKNGPEYKAILTNIEKVISGEVDPTGGADHFYAPETQRKLGRPVPEWDKGGGKDIGAHRFFSLNGQKAVAVSAPDNRPAAHKHGLGLTLVPIDDAGQPIQASDPRYKAAMDKLDASAKEVAAERGLGSSVAVTNGTIEFARGYGGRDRPVPTVTRDAATGKETIKAPVIVPTQSASGIPDFTRPTTIQEEMAREKRSHDAAYGFWEGAWNAGVNNSAANWVVNAAKDFGYTPDPNFKVTPEMLTSDKTLPEDMYSHVTKAVSAEHYQKLRGEVTTEVEHRRRMEGMGAIGTTLDVVTGFLDPVGLAAIAIPEIGVPAMIASKGRLAAKLFRGAEAGMINAGLMLPEYANRPGAEFSQVMLAGAIGMGVGSTFGRIKDNPHLNAENKLVRDTVDNMLNEDGFTGLVAGESSAGARAAKVTTREEIRTDSADWMNPETARAAGAARSFDMSDAIQRSKMLSSIVANNPRAASVVEFFGDYTRFDAAHLKNSALAPVSILVNKLAPEVVGHVNPKFEAKQMEYVALKKAGDTAGADRAWKELQSIDPHGVSPRVALEDAEIIARRATYSYAREITAAREEWATRTGAKRYATGNIIDDEVKKFNELATDYIEATPQQRATDPRFQNMPELAKAEKNWLSNVQHRFRDLFQNPGEGVPPVPGTQNLSEANWLPRMRNSAKMMEMNDRIGPAGMKTVITEAMLKMRPDMSPADVRVLAEAYYKKQMSLEAGQELIGDRIFSGADLDGLKAMLLSEGVERARVESIVATMQNKKSIIYAGDLQNKLKDLGFTSDELAGHIKTLPKAAEDANAYYYGDIKKALEAIGKEKKATLRRIAKSEEKKANGNTSTPETRKAGNEKAKSEYAEWETTKLQPILEQLAKQSDASMGGKHARTKQRALLDVNQKTRVTDKDGNVIDVAMKDWMHRDLDYIVNRYTQQAAGLVALARVQIPSGEYHIKRTQAAEARAAGDIRLADELDLEVQGMNPWLVNGIHGAGDIDKIKSVARDVGYQMGMDKAKVERQLQGVDYLYKAVAGIPLNDPNAVSTRVLKTAKDIAYVKAQMNFMSQIPDLIRLPFAFGTRAMIESIPMLKSFMKAGRRGELDNQFLRDIEMLVPVGNDRLMMKINQHHDDADMSSFTKFERGLGKAKDLTGVMGFMMQTDNMLKKWSTLAAFQRFAQEAAEGGAIRPERLAFLGLDNAMIARINSTMKQHVKGWDGKDTGSLMQGKYALNVEKWDPEVFDALSTALFRWSRRVVQENNAGQLNHILGSALGTTFTQFRTFMLGSYTSQFLHGMNYFKWNNPESFGLMSASIFWGTLVSIANTYRRASLMHDEKERQKMLDEKLQPLELAKSGFELAGWSSVIPTVVDTGATAFGFTPIFSENLRGSPASIILGNPVSGLHDTFVNSSKKIGNIATGEASRQDVQQLIRNTGIGNYYPFAQLAHQATKTLPLPDK